MALFVYLMQIRRNGGGKKQEKNAGNPKEPH